MTTRASRNDALQKDELNDVIFTGLPEVDIQILDNLDKFDLHRACQINTYLRKLCVTDSQLSKRLNEKIEVIDKITKIKPIGTLYDLKERQYLRNPSYSNRIIYQSMKGLTIYLHDSRLLEYVDEKYIDNNIHIEGPVRLTIRELFDILAEHLPPTKKFLKIYGDYIYFEGFQKHHGDYYLRLGS